MSQHNIACVVWMLALAAAFLLPPHLRAAAWGLATALFLVAITIGVVSIRSNYFGRAVLSGADRAAVALTFDDGPDPASTPGLLDLLKRRRATATFFVVGDKVRNAPDLVRRCADEGHEVGNHSDHHSVLLNLRMRAGMRADITRCQRTLEETLGQAASLYRPPAGLRNHAVHPACKDLGLRVIGWNVHSHDRSSEPPADVADEVLRGVGPGAIVLLHDGGLAPERVVTITERILDGLDERGLQTVRISQLLDPRHDPA